MEPMSRVERAALCNTALETGPDAPTLCEGWDVRELVVHLLVRERDPLGSPGIAVKRLAPLTERASRSLREQDFTALVERVRTGPPWWNPMRLAPVDRLGNTLEFFVHHEDVRRAQPDWQPRELTERDQTTLFRHLGAAARGLLRGAPGPVVLRTPGGREQQVGRGEAADTVTVTGDPAELALFTFGRDATHVALTGDEDAVQRLRETHRGL